MKTLFTLAIACFTLSIAQAQQVVSVKEFLAVQKTQSGAQALGSSNGNTSKSAVESMLYDVHPSILLNNNKKTVTGNSPAVVIKTDVSSLSTLASMSDRPGKVMLLEVRIRNIQDLKNAVLTAAMLENLSSLSFIVFKSDVPCSATDIKKLVPSTLAGVTVLFDVQRPS